MTPMAGWEQLLLGVLVVLVLLWFAPGLKALFKQSSEAKERDWVGFWVPIGVVVLFVVVLLMLV